MGQTIVVCLVMALLTSTSNGAASWAELQHNAMLLQRDGFYQEAAGFYEQAVRQGIQEFGEQDDRLAATLSYLGVVYQHLMRHREAERAGSRRSLTAIVLRSGLGGCCPTSAHGQPGCILA